MLQNSKLKTHIIEFFRFIDDGSMIICIDFEDIKHFLTTVASYYPKELEIEFKGSKFNTNFLDLTYGIGAETYCNDKCYYRVYQKPFNAYSYTNYTSNHPKGVFKGIIATEYHRYRNFSCNEKEYKHICNLFWKRLKKCNYPASFIRRHMLYYHPDTNEIIKKDSRYQTVCKLIFDKSNNKNIIIKKILQNKYKGIQSIGLSYKTDKKLKTRLLTKKKLHKKLQKYLTQSASNN